MLVDFEGIQSTMVSYAVSMADLVLVPMQASQLDAPKAASMIRLIKQQERVARRTIPYALVLTRTTVSPAARRSISKLNLSTEIPMMQTKCSIAKPTTRCSRSADAGFLQGRTSVPAFEPSRATPGATRELIQLLEAVPAPQQEVA